MRRRSFSVIHERAQRNMRQARASKQETFLVGAGSGLLLLAIGVIILVINVQNMARPTVPLMTTLFHLPLISLVLGGGLTLFGLYWVLRNIWLFVSWLRTNKSAS